MSYIDEIFARLDMQCIREYLMHGGETTDIDKRSYHERLITTEKSMTHLLHSKFPDSEEYESVTDVVLDNASACENVYMEIGLQCGIVLGMQIMSNTKRGEQP